MDEKKFLEKLAKNFGVENVLVDIQEKKIKEQKMLESLAKGLGTENILEQINEKKEKEKRLLDNLNKTLLKLSEPELKQVEEVFSEPVDITPTLEFNEIVEEQLIEQPELITEIGKQPEPELPKNDIVNKTVIALSKPNEQDGNIQAVADKLPAGIQKELDIIKKSIADFHRFAQRHSQMGGGGEVNLRYLDDVDRSDITNGNFLKYNISKKKFEFANVTSNGVDWKHVPSDIIPEANNYYTLGNSSMRWESLWVGGNSVTFSDQNVSFPDQTLTVANGIFYITDSLDTKLQSNAGFQVGNFLLQNNYISLTNTTAEFFIGATLATGNLVINRPIVVKSHDTGNTTFSVTREGRVTIFAPSIPAGDVGAMSIIGSANGDFQPVTNPGGMLHITGNDGYSTRFNIDNFSTGNTSSFNAVIGRAGRGTANTPAALQANDIMLRIGTVGWKTESGFGGAAVTSQSLDLVALETFYDNSRGTAFKFYNAPLGGSARTLSLTVDSNGIYSNNITSYSNISGNSATFTSNVHIGNDGVATKLVVSGGANDQILVSNGTTLNWTPRHTDGSWTPVMIPATGSNVVFTVNNGKYVKVGPIVTAHFDIVVSSKGTASGDLKLGGLPFTSLAGSAGNYEGTVSMGYFSDLNIADAIHFSGAVIQNSNTADLWLSKLNGQQISQAPMNTTDVKITSRFVGTVIYTTDF